MPTLLVSMHNLENQLLVENQQNQEFQFNLEICDNLEAWYMFCVEFYVTSYNMENSINMENSNNLSIPVNLEVFQQCGKFTIESCFPSTPVSSFVNKLCSTVYNPSDPWPLIVLNHVSEQTTTISPPCCWGICLWTFSPFSLLGGWSRSWRHQLDR